MICTQHCLRRGADPRQNVYSRLGVKTVINCRGTWTYLSGSLEFPEVLQAQEEAAKYFVNMLELQRAVGKRLSGTDGRRIGHRHFRVRWGDGGCDGRVHGGHERQTHLATSGHDWLEA